MIKKKKPLLITKYNLCLRTINIDLSVQKRKKGRRYEICGGGGYLQQFSQ